MDEIETGNLEDLNPGNDWKVGHFIQNRPNFKTSHTEFKWTKFDKDESKTQAAFNKHGSSLTILIQGEITMRFPHDKTKDKTLRQEGDYAFFAPGVCHSWEGKKGTKVMTVRWPSIKDDQVACDH